MSNETKGSPVGRLVYGKIFEPATTGYQGKALDHPQYIAQIAIPKTCPELPALFSDIQAEALRGFPGGEHQRADFAWKFKDGDAPEHQGKEGWAGCYVFRFTSGFAIQVVDQNFQQILDPNAIRNGYQIRVGYSVKANGDQSKPGVFLNFSMVQLVAQDKEIITGPSAAQVFGTPAQALPQQPGAVATPPGGAQPAPAMPPQAAPAMPPQAAPAMPPQAAPAMPAALQPAQPQTAPAPDPGFLKVPGQ